MWAQMLLDTRESTWKKPKYMLQPPEKVEDKGL